jgi:hypothetical protein
MITVCLCYSPTETACVLARLQADGLHAFPLDFHAGLVSNAMGAGFGPVRIAVPDSEAADAISSLCDMGPLPPRRYRWPMLIFFLVALIPFMTPVPPSGMIIARRLQPAPDPVAAGAG